ncbi:MAG: M16 family metallopeptidase [Gemmatimonadaceae bacterium]
MTYQTFARRVHIVAAAFVALNALPLAAQLPQGLTKGATVEGITEYTLDNGLRVLLFPDASKPTATINITYLVGSRHEGYGETGMAHLLEHLVFKGSTKHPNIPQELTVHGSRPNGTTWYDRTNYFETVPATDENIDWALDLEADRMVNSFIAKKDLETEFSVVRNEYEAGENFPSNVLLQRLMSTAFLWHNYGKSTIGARSDIENVPIERLQAFYRKYYQPDNAILVVAGRVDEAKVLGLIAQKFGAIPRPTRSLERGNMIFPTYTEEPVQDGEREVTLRRVGDVQVAMAGYHVPAGPHPDFPAVSVLANILATQPSGRLYKALVEPKKASFASANAWQLREPGMLIAQATLRKDQSLTDVKSVLVATVEEVTRATPTAEEVDRAKTQLLKNIELGFSNTTSIALQISEWASGGDWRVMFIHRDRLRKVTPADVQRVAQTYLKPANRTVGTFVPTEKPDRAVVAAVSDAELNALVRDYKGDQSLAVGEVFDPSPANIEARTLRTTLPNGMKVALLPKENRGDVVTAAVTLRFGSEATLGGQTTTAARMMGTLLDKGTKAKTRQQIRDEFDHLKAQVFFFSSGNAITSNITTTRANVVPTLRLVAEVLKEPIFDPNEFEVARQATLTSLESQKSEPTSRAFNAFQRKLSPYPQQHPLYVQTLDEQIATYRSLTVAAVKTVHSELVGASHGDFAIVGDFNRDSVLSVARELFGSWRSPKSFARLKRTFFDVPPSVEKIETPDKANAVYVTGLNFKIRDDSRDYAALTLGGYIFGGGFLNSRLATRIRQREGISYGIGAGVSAQPLDSVGSLTANAIYNPENVLRLENALREELDRVLKDGVTADEVDKAKQGWLQQQLQNRSQDGFLVNLISSQALTGRTMAFNTEFEGWVAGLTPTDVNAAMRKYIDPAKLAVVKAGDFANKPPKQLIVP